MASFFFFLGVISDTLVIYNKIWSTLIGKAFLLIIYALGTTIAYGLSGQIVNEIIQFDTSAMTRTINFVAILLIPLFIFIILAIIFVILGYFYILFIQLIKDLKIKIKLEYYPWWTFTIRFISYILVFSFTFTLLTNLLPSYSKFLKDYTSAFIYYVESVRFSRCKNIPLNTRVLPINENEIITIRKTKDGYIFNPMACNTKISSKIKQ
ncbi:hypothetical protein [Neisseria animaloris]|uniref:hypothetical protein n=1 Tax=Neisseria animaloris TaxID=326522 RepID=UPI00131A7983|nr:hypothetical protein [Neisseria animaloris]